MATARNSFEDFNTRDGDIECYLEQLGEFLIAHDLPDDEDSKAKRKSTLLSAIGAETYKTLRDLCFPQKPTEKTYAQLCALLKGHFAPKRIVTAERFKFHNTKQQPGQSVTSFAAHLKKMATHCGFVGESLQESLRDRFVCGLSSEHIQRKLLSRDYTFQQALDTALAEEMANVNVRQMSSGHQPSSGNHGNHGGTVNKLGQKFKGTHSSFKPCYRCGFDNHLSSDCRYKTTECFKCGKVGHLKSMCKSSQSGASAHGYHKSHTPMKTHEKGRTYKKGSKVHYMAEDEDDKSEDFIGSVFSITEDNDNQSEESEEEGSDGESDKEEDRRPVPALKVPVTIEDAELIMELDTGASRSIITHSYYLEHFRYLHIRKVNRPYVSYGGTPLKILGEITVDVKYHSQSVCLNLLVADVEENTPPLLGRSWLKVLKLDWTNIATQMGDTIYTCSDAIQDVLEKYPDVFQEELGSVKGMKATLHVKEGTVPVFLKARNVAFAMRPAVEKELERMQSEGIIKPVEFSEWATPLVCIPKSDGTVRICGDYKCTVNLNLHTEQFPIPTPEELYGIMAGGKKFTKIDLKCAYQQMLLDEKSQELVTINTHRGLFRYIRLPFGISSSPAIWQRFIEQVLAGLDHVCAIMDDVLISGKDNNEHLANIDKVLQRFQKYGLRVKTEKCHYMKDSVVYMGLRISAEGVQPNQEKVEAIKKAPVPQNVHELRSWLGMLNFQAKFIPNISTIIHPLNQLLGNKEWQWTNDCETAFRKAKDAITSDRLLAHYDPELALFLAADASPYGLGATIMQTYPDGSQRPVAYASRSLNKHEKGYGQLDKEALAIIFGLKRFRNYVYGRKFTILTDHKPLVRILGPKIAIPALAAQRLQRWALLLSAFNYEIQFIPSRENALADALSRLPLANTGEDADPLYQVEEKRLNSLPITSREIAQATKADPILSRVLHFTRTGWPSEVDEALKPYFNRRIELSVEQDCVLLGLRVLIPNKHQDEILKELHVAHPGIVRMKEVARSFVWWPHIDIDIDSTVKQCKSCQQTRSTPSVAPLTPWEWPGLPWSRVHVDFAMKDNHDYLIVVDAHSKWPEIVLMKSTTAEATINVLRDLFSKYGLPHQVVSDNGPQFRSEEFTHFLKMNGVKPVKVAPYHPASNGAAERMVQTFKNSLTASKTGSLTIQQCIARFLLQYRTTAHATTGRTPASLFLGRELRTRITLVRPDLQGKVLNQQSDQKLFHNKKKGLREFYPGDQVLVKDVRRDGTWWSGTVAERTAQKSYVIVLEDGRVWKRHIDNLRLNTDLSKMSTSRDGNSGLLSEISVDKPVPDMYQREEVVIPGRHVTEETTALEMTDPSAGETESSEVCAPSPSVTNLTTPLRRSARHRQPPDRLIETV